MEMIDHSINLDKTKLPKVLQNTIKELEKFDKEKNYEMYDGLSEGLESFAKSFLLSGDITDNQFEQLLKKYRR